ncbi:MAG: four-helix bundle copper-binding protein [Candidatus Bathyarchaeia archaeon]
MPESYSEPDKNFETQKTTNNAETTKEHDQPDIMTGTEVDKEDWSRGDSQVAGRLTGTMEDLERMQEAEFLMSEEVRECIQDCVDCYRTCNQTLIRCLNMGGKHAEVEHANLIMDCARICNTNADFMLRNSLYYPQTCGLTADICDECGDVCDRFEDDFMKECASVCRRCAESCREMAR